MIGRPSAGSEADSAYWAAVERQPPSGKILRELGTNAGVHAANRSDAAAFGLASSPTPAR